MSVNQTSADVNVLDWEILRSFQIAYILTKNIMETFMETLDIFGHT